MLRRTGLIALVTASLTSLAAFRAQEAPRHAGAAKTGFSPAQRLDGLTGR